MKLQLLLSVLNFNNRNDVIKHVATRNIKSDLIVVNQSDFMGEEEWNSNGRSINFISMSNKGVGLSRNTALIHSKSEIVMFVDDDETFLDDYENKILDAFKKYPKADAIIFNVTSNNLARPSAHINKFHRVRWYNFMRYGAYQIAIKRESIMSKNISFSTFFGGGCKYGSGEDSLFLSTILDNGLTIYASPDIIATVEQKSSTWFKGYDKKYFFDRGVLYTQIFKFPRLIGLIQLIRKRKSLGDTVSFCDKFKCFCEGVHEGSNLK